MTCLTPAAACAAAPLPRRPAAPTAPAVVARWLLGPIVSLLVVLAALLLGQAAQAADDFLPESKAFSLAADTPAPGVLRLSWTVAPQYHLYRERMAVQADDAAQPAPVLGPLQLPDGKREFDANFNKEVEIYTGQVQGTATLQAGDGRWRLRVTHQGCADAGLCYPPTTRQLDVTVAAGAITALQVLPADDEGGSFGAAAPSTGSVVAAALGQGATAAPPAETATPAGGDNDVARVLQAGRLLPVMGVFWLAGLFLSFTPCVLPMVPILSSIIVGQGEAVSRGKGFALALAYALGMALVYTGFGVLAGWLGEGLAGYLQNPWVLGAFAALLAGLSLSMFGVYELQVPAALQGRLSEASNRLPGGRFAGVFAMGGLSALIVGPCVAAPLAGALVYIGQTHDLVLGGAALFSLAMGMSVPLLLVGLSAGTLLPRAGAWMTRVKYAFGLLLLAVAWWLLSPVLPAPLVLAGWGTLALACGLALWSAQAQAQPHGHGGRAVSATAVKTLALALLVLGLAQWLGALSGGRDLLQPLAHLARPVAGAGEGAASGERHTAFRRVRNLAELEQVLAQASRPVMLDFYADWCVSCIEMEKFTFSDPAVAAQLQRFELLQVDVTANNPDDRALLKRFGLFGPPGILFFAPGGAERPDLRVIGFQKAPAFSAVLAKALAPV